mmetsp:Transcript_90824/g.293217  ORF Transcript_90824/g.293217 Transcript_90824/m.293217 type:complete len:2155 (+) Transcript_90824:115-6579(+)
MWAPPPTTSVAAGIAGIAGPPTAAATLAAAAAVVARGGHVGPAAPQGLAAPVPNRLGPTGTANTSAVAGVAAWGVGTPVPNRLGPTRIADTLAVGGAAARGGDAGPVPNRLGPAGIADTSADAAAAWVDGSPRGFAALTESRPARPQAIGRPRAAAASAPPSGAEAVGVEARSEGSLRGAPGPRGSSPPERSLSKLGLPDAVVEAYAAKGIRELYEWQGECLATPGVDEGRNLVYCAPTSGGKTIVSEILMLRRVAALKKRAIFVLPFVSIVMEKTKYLQDICQGGKMVVKGFYGGSLDGIREKFDVAVCTIEKANALVNLLIQEGALAETLCTFVVDELHLVGDGSRGYLLEVTLSKVLYLAKDVQVLGMSATLPNVNDIARWTNAALYQTGYRPVPLSEFVLLNGQLMNTDGSVARKLSSEDLPAPPSWAPSPAAASSAGPDASNLALVAATWEVTREGHSVLVFCSSKVKCEKAADLLAQRLPAAPGEENRLAARQVVVDAIRQQSGGSDALLARALLRGVAFHHSGLTTQERGIIERGYREGLVVVICATSTLAAGVNLPARRVIFQTPFMGNAFLDSTQYKQMAGRAGRAGQGVLGESVMIANTRSSKQIFELVGKTLPRVSSALGNDQRGLKRLLLEVLSITKLGSGHDLIHFCDCTLLSNQKPDGRQLTGDPVKDHPEIAEAVQWLMTHDMVRLDDRTQSYSVTPLGRAVCASSLEPQQGYLLFQELQRARPCISLDTDLHICYLVTPPDGQIPVDWAIFSNVLKHLSPAERRVVERTGVRLDLVSRAEFQGRLPAATLASLDGVRLVRFFSSLVLWGLLHEVPPPQLLQRFGLGRGHLQQLQQSAAAFTQTVAVFCGKLQWHGLEALIISFQQRLTFGVRQELVPLMQIPGMDCIVARTLYEQGFTTPVGIAGARSLEILRVLRRTLPPGFPSAAFPEERAELLIEAAKKLSKDSAKDKRKRVQEARKELREGLSEPPRTEPTQKRARANPAERPPPGAAAIAGRAHGLPGPPTGASAPVPGHGMSGWPQATSATSLQSGHTGFATALPQAVSNVSGAAPAVPRAPQAHAFAPVPSGGAPAGLRGSGSTFGQVGAAPPWPMPGRFGREQEAPQVVAQQGAATTLAARGRPPGSPSSAVQEALRSSAREAFRAITTAAGHAADVPQRSVTNAASAAAVARAPFVPANMAVGAVPVPAAAAVRAAPALAHAAPAAWSGRHPQSSPCALVPMRAVQPDVRCNSGLVAARPSTTQRLLSSCATPCRRSEGGLVPQTLGGDASPPSTAGGAQAAGASQPSPEQLREGLRRIGRHSLTPEDVEAVSVSPARGCNSVQVASPHSGQSAATPPAALEAEGSIRAFMASTFAAPHGVDGIELPRLEVLDTSDALVCGHLGARMATCGFLGACIVAGASPGLEFVCISLSPTEACCLALPSAACPRGSGEVWAWFRDPRRLCITPDAKELAGTLLRRGVDVCCALAEPRIALWLLDPDDKQHTSITDIAALLDVRAKMPVSLSIGAGPGLVGGRAASSLDAISRSRLASCWPEAFLALPAMAALLRRLHGQGLLDSFWNVEMPISVVLASMEHFGIGCATYDPMHTNSHILYRIAAIQERVKQIVGRQVLLSSSEDVGRAIFEDLALPVPRSVRFARKTNGRIAYRTPVEVLRSLAPNPIVELVLEHRQLTHAARRLESLLRSGGPPRAEPACAGVGVCACCSVQGAGLSGADELLAVASGMAARPRAFPRLRSEFVQTGTATGRLSTATGSFPILCLENPFQMREVVRPSVHEELAAGRQPEAGARVFVAVATAPPPGTRHLREGELQGVGTATCVEPFPGGSTPLAEYWVANGWTAYADASYARQVRQVVVRQGSSFLTYPADRVWRLAAPVHIDDAVAPILVVNPRQLLVAEAGRVLLSVDYSQLEVRIMAHFSQDERFVQILHGEGDVFRHVAAGWLRKPEAAVTAEERGGAKRICYGLVYGIGVSRLASELGISRAQAQEFQESFMREYAGITAWVQSCRDAARRCGYVETLHSRRRFLPALASRSRAEREHAERQAVNSSCQASAADLVKTAMLAIHSRLKTMRVREDGECRMAARMLLQVHDELLFEVHESSLDAVRAMVVAEMIGAGRDLRVPLQVKWRVGRTFGTLE